MFIPALHTAVSAEEQSDLTARRLKNTQQSKAFDVLFSMRDAAAAVAAAARALAPGARGEQEPSARGAKRQQPPFRQLGERFLQVPYAVRDATSDVKERFMKYPYKRELEERFMKFPYAESEVEKRGEAQGRGARFMKFPYSERQAPPYREESRRFMKFPYREAEVSKRFMKFPYAEAEAEREKREERQAPPYREDSRRFMKFPYRETEVSKRFMKFPYAEAEAEREKREELTERFVKFPYRVERQAPPYRQLDLHLAQRFMKFPYREAEVSKRFMKFPYAEAEAERERREERQAPPYREDSRRFMKFPYRETETDRARRDELTERFLKYPYRLEADLAKRLDDEAAETQVARQAPPSVARTVVKELPPAARDPQGWKRFMKFPYRDTGLEERQRPPTSIVA